MSPASGPRPTSPLIGRGPELAAAGAVLDAPDGRGILLTGALGVGKTRLATEIMGRRAAAGAMVLRVIATAATADIPLGALAAVAPGTARVGERRDAVADQVGAEIAAAADGSPVLIVIDDVDLLDPQSHVVIRSLVERRVVKVVGTVRTPHRPLPLPWSGPGLVALGLSDLDEDGVAEMLVTTLGGPVAGGTTRALSSATGGNPLLVREALDAASHDGTLRQVDGIWSLAEGAHPVGRLGDLVGSRLAQISPEARDALELVAMAEVLPDTLASELIAPALLAQLEVAGLVVRDTALGHGVVRPAHPAYGDALRAGLGPISRRHHARRLADAAESDASELGAVDVMRVVAWRVAAGGRVSAELLGHAAREARRRSEFDLAEDLASRAVRAGGGPPAVLLLGEIQNATGRYHRAEATFATVVDPLVRGADPAPGSVEDGGVLGLAALAAAFNQAWGLGHKRAARDRLRAVAEVLGSSGGGGPEVTAVRAELDADAAALAAFTGDPAAAVAEADALLVDPASSRVVARASFAAAAGRLLLGQPDTAVTRSEEGLAALGDLPAGFGRVTFTANLMLTLVMGHLETGRIAEADTIAATVYRQSIDTSLTTGQAAASWARGRVLEMRGDWSAAERWQREARSLERELQTLGRARWSMIGLARVLMAQGRAAEAAAVVADLDVMDADLAPQAAPGPPPDDAFLLAEEIDLRAAVRAADGELRAADDLRLAHTRHLLDHGVRGAALTLAHAACVAAASRRTMRAAAEMAAEAAPHCEGSLHEARRCDAAAAADGDLDARVDIARQLLGLGAVALARGILARVAGEAAEQGRRGLAATAQEWLSDPVGPPEGELSPLARLAPRPREVALLAARGSSNSEIADRLGISVRTVENHLHRCYSELGVEGRRGLAALVDGAR